MSIKFISSHPYMHVELNRENIKIFTERRSVNHSESDPLFRERNGINAITIMNLNGALFRAQTSQDMILCDLSQHMEIFGVVERLRSLLLSLKGLRSEQWGSLHSEVVPNIFSLLYCCVMDCSKLKSTPPAISPTCYGLVACHLALQCVYSAALMNWNERNSQEKKVTEAMEQLCDMRAMYRPEPAIYHSQAVLDLLRGGCEPGHTMGPGSMHVSFGEENHSIQAEGYTGHGGRLSFKFSLRGDE